MAIRRSNQSMRPGKVPGAGKITRADAERMARQLSAETGQKVTADDVLGKKSKATNKPAAPTQVPSVAQPVKAQPDLETPGWDGGTGFEAKRDLAAVVGGDRQEGTEAPPVRADAQTQAEMQRQLAIMMARKV